MTDETETTTTDGGPTGDPDVDAHWATLGAEEKADAVLEMIRLESFYGAAVGALDDEDRDALLWALLEHVADDDPDDIVHLAAESGAPGLSAAAESFRLPCGTPIFEAPDSAIAIAAYADAVAGMPAEYQPGALRKLAGYAARFADLAEAGPVIVTEDEVRARPTADGTCFYCAQPVGEPHGSGCVLLIPEDELRQFGEVCDVLERQWHIAKGNPLEDDGLLHTSDVARAGARCIFEIMGVG